MRNVATAVEGSKLHLIVDLDESGEQSKSGKSIVIGSTEGNKAVKTPAGELMVGLNVYRKLA
jgi:hypothetical protein